MKIYKFTKNYKSSYKRSISCHEKSAVHQNEWNTANVKECNWNVRDIMMILLIMECYVYWLDTNQH